MKYQKFFNPCFFQCLADYKLSTLRKDVMAGVTVGVVALPLSMAFAIASGVKPEAGIITAIIAGFLTSFLGGTRTAIGGPTGAFIVIVLGIVLQYGVENLIICTMMAGAMLFLLGVFKMGWFANYFPYPLISGFTSGIAVTIFSTQLKDILGLPASEPSSGVLAALYHVFENLHFINMQALIFTIVCSLAIVYWPKKAATLLPGPIGVLILGTLASIVFGLPLETIGDRFVEGIPSTLPSFHLPTFDLATFQFLLGPAVTIALLGGIESILCAVVADTMTDQKHDSNQELMAQGISNMVAPLFGGIPATGAIVRTATNIRNGGLTPVAGMVHAITLLLIMLLAAPYAKFVPLALLAAILVVVAINMGEWATFTRLHILPKSDSVVLLLTFFLTVIFDLTVAVQVGILVSCILFIRRMSTQATIKVSYIHYSCADEKIIERSEQDPLRGSSDLLVLKMSGEFFFGATHKLQLVTSHLNKKPKAILIKMKRVSSIDASTLMFLKQLFIKAQLSGVKVFVAGLSKQPQNVIVKSGLLDQVGAEYFIYDLHTAIKTAWECGQGNDKLATDPTEPTELNKLN